ncbi:MAG: hypothetical protein QOH05_3323 [Acetobacteraceae bacterium]|jgi:hypothetical protein|nr:hypothetical protein [Acetobacteraceae bacterium]
MAPIADIVLSFSAAATQPAQVAVASDVDMIPITLYTTSTNGTDGELMHAISAVCRGCAFLRNDANTIEATATRTETRCSSIRPRTSSPVTLLLKTAAG